MKSLSLLIASAFGLCIVACGPGDGTGAGGSGGSGTFSVVKGAPQSATEEPEQATFEMEGYANVAASRGGFAVVGTTTAVFAATPEGMSKLEILGDEPDLPANTGIVYAMAPVETGVLVASEMGIFVAADGALVRSNGHEALFPLSIEGIVSRVADEDGDGTEEAHLTIRTEDSLKEYAPGKLVTWSVDGENGAPSAALAQRDRLYAAWGSRVYEIDKADGDAYLLPEEIGKVNGMACSNLACDAVSSVYFATDSGLLERSPAGDYVLYTLANDGAPSVAVTGFAFDSFKQRLYALTAGAVLRVYPEKIPEEISPLADAGGLRVATVDKPGDVWTFDLGTATRLSTGTPLSFASDVAPIMGEYCAPCHKDGKNGAPAIDFEVFDVMVDIGDTALNRIGDGSMPPPGWPQIPKEQVGLIAEWLTTKAP